MEYCKSVKKKKNYMDYCSGFHIRGYSPLYLPLNSSEQFDPNASFVTQKLENLRSTLKFEILETNLSFSGNTIG